MNEKNFTSMMEGVLNLKMKIYLQIMKIYRSFSLKIFICCSKISFIEKKYLSKMCPNLICCSSKMSFFPNLLQNLSKPFKGLLCNIKKNWVIYNLEKT